MRTCISGRYLYFATETSLTVDGRLIGTSGGFRLTESASGSFAGRDGVEHPIELQVSAGLFTLTHLVYVLRIDGIVISKGELKIERLALTISAYGIVALIGVAATVALYLGFRDAPKPEAGIGLKPPPAIEHRARSITTVPVGPAAWIVITVGQAVAADKNPLTNEAWDNQTARTGDDCVTVGLLFSLFGPPVLGKLAHSLCAEDERQKAEGARVAGAPDLAVWLHTSNGANAKRYATRTERDQLSPVFNEDFVIPTDAIPEDGSLHLRVLDMDGPKVVGDVLLWKAQMRDAVLTGRELLLSDPEHGLKSIGLTIRSYDGGEHVKPRIDTKNGISPVTFAARESHAVRAGEVIELFASGSYKIGEDGGICGGWVGPGGIVGEYVERCKEDNLASEPFRSARRGVGIAVIGNANARERIVVAPCASIVSSIAGPLRVGVNDKGLSNNTGMIDFEVTVRPPTVDEWMTKTAPPCGENAP